MSTPQAGILAPVPPLARHMLFTLQAGATSAAVREAVLALVELADGESCVVGLGASLVATLGAQIDGLHGFPTWETAGVAIPATPAALWCWLRGDDRGELLHRGRVLEQALAPAFALERGIDAFRYGASLDLTGYEDGTENPTDEAALAAALVTESGPGLEGSSRRSG